MYVEISGTHSHASSVIQYSLVLTGQDTIYNII